MFFMKKYPFVSVVIVTFNGTHVIGECLESLSEQTYGINSYEVLVVDDGSSDPKLLPLLVEFEKKIRNYRVVSYQPNEGISHARNVGWKEARGEIVAYTDDDAVVDKDWVARLAAGYDEDTAGVGGYARPYDESNLFSLFDQAMTFYLYGVRAEKVDGAGGNNMSFRRSVLESVGGFNENLKYVADEAYINALLTKKGYKLKVIPDLTVKHKVEIRSRWHFFKKRFNRGKGAYIYDTSLGLRRSVLLRQGLKRLCFFPGFVLKNLKVGETLGELVKQHDLRAKLAQLFLIETLATRLGYLWAGLVDLKVNRRDF